MACLVQQSPTMEMSIDTGTGVVAEVGIKGNKRVWCPTPATHRSGPTQAASFLDVSYPPSHQTRLQMAFESNSDSKLTRVNLQRTHPNHPSYPAALMEVHESRYPSSC